MATYSNDKDVASKYSHLKISSNVIVKDYREEAYNDINMKLRSLYAIPIDSTDSNDLAYLKSIESRLSAGNILIAVSTVDQLKEVHEYGKFLIDQAYKKLGAIMKEEIILTGATKDTDKSDNVIDPPVIQGSAADDHATFDRPMSGIENDALEGVVDSEKYDSLEDNKEVV
jgi:hypothetical protein